MKLPLGEMREPVVVRIRVTTVDESGGEVAGYAESDPIFVSIRAVGSRELLAYGTISADVSHVCFGHWHDLKDIRSDARIRMLETDQEFDVVGPAVQSPERDFAKLTLVWRENG